MRIWGFIICGKIKDPFTKDLQKGDNELMYVPFYMTGMI